MLTSLRTLALVWLLLQVSLLRANSVRNGGDTIHCHQTPSAELVGDFMLDYVATYDFAGHNRDVHLSGDSVNEVLSDMEMRLRNVPVLGEDFSQFLHDYAYQVSSGPTPTVRNMWEKSDLGLIPLDDQDLIAPLPDNCYDDATTHQAKLRQVVVQERRAGVSGIIYHYDSKVIATLESSPIQISFLLVHEWLWRYAEDAGIVRAANRLLHSDRILKMSGPDILYALENLGLKVGDGIEGAPTLPIEIHATRVRQPNGRPALRLDAEWFVVPEKTERLRFINGASDPMELRRQDTGATICRIGAASRTEKPFCELPVRGMSFPVELFYEREPLVEPLYDSARFTLFR